jgi:trehalose/maltose transport system substrate-binding protein
MLSVPAFPSNNWEVRMKGKLLKLAAVCGALAVGNALAVEVTVVCGAVGQELELCKSNAGAWATKTGNTVRVLETVNSSTDRLAYYQQNLTAGNDSIDVYQIDVVWPGILNQYFLDLKPYLTAADTKPFTASIYNNYKIGAKVVALPWFTDGGILFYRTDLLKKYGYNAAPKTWNELVAQATKIQAGERRTNRNFYGYVYQGNAYEGLTCDALEWINSFGGGTIIDANGNITVNNEKAVQAIDTVAKNFKAITPPGVTSYQEEESRGVWQSGNAAFMRNWPYAYALGQQKDEKTGKLPVIAGKFDVAPLPAGAGGKSSATQGGWGLAVSKFSKNPKEAADLVKFMTSTEIQKERAVKGSFAPTIQALYQDKDVLAAAPHFKAYAGTTFVARPSAITAAKYNQVSSAFWTAVHNVLTGKANAKNSLASLEKQLTTIKGPSW